MGDQEFRALVSATLRRGARLAVDSAGLEGRRVGYRSAAQSSEITLEGAPLLMPGGVIHNSSRNTYLSFRPWPFDLAE
jgi:hypothetical protein